MVLEFDHVTDKTDAVTVMAANGVSIDKLASEIEKCVIRCSNCHVRKTRTESNDRRARFLEN